jgi:hypothetical protein
LFPSKQSGKPGSNTFTVKGFNYWKKVNDTERCAFLTLPVSTATTERTFSAMKIVKTRLCNRMEDDFLTNYLIVYIGKKLLKD